MSLCLPAVAADVRSCAWCAGVCPRYSGSVSGCRSMCQNDSQCQGRKCCIVSGCAICVNSLPAPVCGSVSLAFPHQSPKLLPHLTPLLFIFVSHSLFEKPVRAQELCESGGGRPGLPVPNSPYGLCGRKATLKH